ncbi:hypothetical protein GLOTRDRAFT_123335 [Gloeophyllum trabeum ATCC 11539]|uniref:Uncharacterized protein n=1 Tax=Gloeophyllum trabeum (strain ATCC 11539 / FP-39264 / Madison 617) TaxID=670483 RepID=S7RF20_GLOTA|nr:uncharacterized protein GLOTRDRAFT_123335 [Gloeophyllum trabeum ATCC 11539]EPQ51079.1 hypothetical protein GLOTRDRAFT_123335 [Gloeophyllum trabeum ATCC 11539]
MAGPIHYPNPPLAGKPPFATDEPDEYFDQQPQPQRRVRQQPADPNARSSAYNVYDNYLERGNRDSGVGALGAGLMNGAVDDDDDDPRNPFQNAHAVAPSAPIAQPKPGYAAPTPAQLLARPAPAASREMSEVGPGPRVVIPPPAPIAVPSTPHPLQPPMTPITPVFARPRKASGDDAGGVKFETSQLRPGIIRGNSEDTTLPRRGAPGDDFWRRFSMVAKSDTKESFWLKKTQNGTSRLSRWVWVVAVTILIVIAGAIGLGWYVSHNKPGHTAPKAIGGSANEAATSSALPASAGVPAASSSPHPWQVPAGTGVRRAIADG